MGNQIGSTTSWNDWLLWCSPLQWYQNKYQSIDPHTQDVFLVWSLFSIRGDDYY